MNPYFSTPERRAALVIEARSWIGTRFHAYSKVKGAGVDCVHLAAEIYSACGFRHDFNPPGYSMDGGSHLEQSLIEAYLQGAKEFHLAWQEGSGSSAAEALPGDLLIFHLGRVTHHVAVLIERDFFIHAIQVHGVTEGCLRDFTYRSRLKRIYRPVEL